MTTQHEPDALDRTGELHTSDDTGEPDPLDEFAALMRDEQVFSRGRVWSQADLARRRRRRRRALLIVLVVVALVLGGSGAYVGWALNAPLAEPEMVTRTPAAPVPVAAPIELPGGTASAIAISGADEYLGVQDGVWGARGTDDPVPMASITKLITALVVLDEVPLTGADDPGPTLSFDRADHKLYDKYYVMGATIAAMPAGSSMSLRDALATMLIPSACNYAEAIANWAFGSNWSFVQAAERWLAANGLTHTTVVEPTGLDPRNTSTAADLIALGRIAAAQPAIAAITAMPSFTAPGRDTVVNTNTLLGVHGVTGLKTGTLDEAGSNLLYTASFDVRIGAPIDVVGVVLGGSSRSGVNGDVTDLLEGIAAGFHTVTVADRGRPVGDVTTPWGSTARLVLDAGASLRTWSDTPIEVTLDARTPATWAEGATAGTVTWTTGPDTVTVPIVLDEGIEPPDGWWRLANPGDLG